VLVPVHASKFIWAVAVLATGWLGVRIVSLEERVARLSARLGSAQSIASETVSDIAASAGPSQSQSARLRQLEAQIDRLTAAPRDVEASAFQRAPVEAENEILSVLEREKSRVRDVQLEFHRSRWLEGRNAQLDAFAKSTGLSTSQTKTLKAQLERELDDFVKVLNNPDYNADPDHAVAEWDTALAKTDAVAHSVLDPKQAQLWDQARMLEKQILWPWLPRH
jgi:hypothetical protein